MSASFPPADTSVAAARDFVRSTVSAWGAGSIVDEAVLLTSEIVTNAVVHAGTQTDVVCSLLPDSVRVEVVDRYPTRWVETPPDQVDEDSESGRGLLLATELASRWGVEYARTTKRVWFQIRLDDANLVTVGAGPAEPIIQAPGPSLAPALIRLDVRGTVLDWGAGATDLLGWSAEDVVGSPLADLLVPDDTDRVADWAGAARWQGSYGLRRPDGGHLAVHARHVRVTRAEGDSVLCLLVDQGLRALLLDPEPSARAVGDEDAPIVPSPASLVRLGLDELLTRTVDWARDTTGADGGYVLLATDTDSDLELRVATGFGSMPPRFPRQEVDEGIPGRLHGTVMPSVHDDLAASAPSVASLDWLRECGVRSLLTVPLLAEGRLIGTVGVTSNQPGRFTNHDAARLQQTADDVALPVQSARLVEMERGRRGWLSYLAEASDLLAGTLELDMTLALVAQLVVPRLAPWCGVYLNDEGGSSHPVYAWHADENRLGDLRTMLDKVPPPPATTELAARRWMPAEGLDLGGVDAVGELAAAGAMVVPLVARGRPIGMLALGRVAHTQPRREILELAADLARRSALALDNARLYEDRTATSMALQRSLLPSGLPVVPGVDIGVSYQAAGAGNDVGGDFYDLFTVGDPAREGDGRFAVAVGDVCGKGPEAAAFTGLARHALRLLGRRGDAVPEVLAQLNRAILDEGDRARFVTTVYGAGEPVEGGGLRLQLASAGHPLPFLLSRDGEVTQVGTPGDLLGVFTQLQSRVFSVELAPDEALVLFTDGVTERRDGNRMLGEDGVREALTGAFGLTAAAVARRLQQAVADFAPGPPRDDVAIMVLRAAPTPVRPRPPTG
ncbi:MAG: SpoIIE family protein phosphatase [Actinomycetes bacterium]